MKNSFLVLYLCTTFIFILSGCSNNPNSYNPQKETTVTSSIQKDSTGCPVPKEEEEEVCQNDSLSLLQRVGQIYNNVFMSYNKGDNSDTYKKYFSKRLEELWNTLPEDYAVVDADPWTWTVEYDSFAFKGAVIDYMSDDSAIVIATSQLYAHYDTMLTIDTSKRMLKLIHETKDEESNWFVDDITDERRNMYFSVSSTIQQHNTYMDVTKTAENLYNKLFDRFNNHKEFEEEAYLSEGLKSLFDKLPTNDIIFPANIWTGLQDFDSISLHNISVEEIKQDSASVKIEFEAFENERSTVCVRFIHENGGWKTDDIIHTDWAYSVAETARKYLEKHIEQK
jgi:hypothetical protein